MKLITILQIIINALVKSKQQILIREIPMGHVLDIGGGGEGVIAQAGGTRVFAIDQYISEIREARGKAPEALWLVADGTALPFASDRLENATAFFSCMYMQEDVKRKVFRETQRVLKNNGEFWIWGSNMSPKNKVFAIRLQATIPENRLIKTIYGVKAKDQSAASISTQLQEAGFETEVVSNHKYWFFIKAKKTKSPNITTPTPRSS